MLYDREPHPVAQFAGKLFRILQVFVAVSVGPQEPGCDRVVPNQTRISAAQHRSVGEAGAPGILPALQV